MKKILKITLLCLLAFLIVFTFAFLYKKSKPKEVEYEIVKAEIKTIEKKTLATGKIEPRNEVLIKPQISGIITAIYKEAGQKVQAGEVIALVKVIPDISSVNAAESRVNTAKIELEQQKSLFDRNQNLYSQKVISQEEFEQYSANYKRAKEEYQSAIDNLEIVKEGIIKRSGQFGNTQIRSTITGTILDIPVKVGNSVIQSNTFNDGTTIASVANLNDMIFNGKIDETEVGRVKVGMPVMLSIGALQNTAFPADLEYIAPKGVEENSTILFEIRAAAHIPDSVTIRAGYSANADITIESRKNVVAIPENAVLIEKDSIFVFKYVKNEGKKQIFEKSPVKIGLSDGIFTEIIEGVDTAMQIRGIEKIQVKK
ncbi:MAG: efflux RND transporter periplasmic adaptor subunit [Prevotellaceae bacterium]|jgi:HlyD family secretion protein|nr:efflux RND transporter periplasmic adaptor subunit [Prevotellaceae bacterium]